MRRSILLVPPAVALVVIAACSGSTLTKGELMVSVQTDMSLPKDVDRIAIQVSVNGSIQFAEEYAVGAGNLLIPATFGVVQGSDPSQPVQIRVLARKAGQLVVLRDATTTVPSGRVATLRMPIEFLCQGQATDGPASSGDTTTQDQAAASTCGAGMTCVAGACVTTTVDSSSLPGFDPAQVFGGASAPGTGGQCLDTVGCFATGEVASVLSTPSECSIPKPTATGAGINVAMASGTGSAGICGTQACLVPLDETPADGWTDEGNGRLALPLAVCARLASHRIDSVVVTTSCATKTPATPTCGPWSSAQAQPATFDAGAPDGAATPTEDAGPDATLGAPDAGAEDASAAPDAAPSCAALLAALASASITPPAGWLSLDLSNGGGFNGAFVDGGLSIDATSLLACASYTEAQTLPAGFVPQEPGSRTLAIGGAPGDAAAPVSVSYNSQSRLIDLAVVSRPATASVSFHSRAGGAFEVGGVTNQYVIGLGPSPAGGTGFVTKNGVDFPLAFNDAGGSPGTNWVNEIYDGLMATFDPTGQGSSLPDGGILDCTQTPLYPNPTGVQKHVALCLDQLAPTGGGAQYFAARPLEFFVGFDATTNHANVLYQFWPTTVPSCTTTPAAVTEQMDFFTIQAQGNFNANLGTTWLGTAIGTIAPQEVFSNPQGLLETEATQLLCNGSSTAAPDPGYLAEQWGGQGEVVLEYEPGGLAYKVLAKAGYKGSLPLQSALADGGAGNVYVLAPGTFTVNGAAVNLNWAGGAAAVDPTITDVSNAWINYWCGPVPPTDTDCVAGGDCQIVPNDGQGNSYFTLITSANVVTNVCGFAIPPLTVTFPQGSSVPSSIATKNLTGSLDGG